MIKIIYETTCDQCYTKNVSLSFPQTYDEYSEIEEPTVPEDWMMFIDKSGDNDGNIYMFCGKNCMIEWLRKNLLRIAV